MYREVIVYYQLRFTGNLYCLILPFYPYIYQSQWHFITNREITVLIEATINQVQMNWWASSV